MFLEDIISRRREQLAREKSVTSPERMRELALTSPQPSAQTSHVFRNALLKDGLSVIAEVKKASPSKGLIQPDFNPAAIAKAYEAAGASAISCLTEEHYFQGSSEYLADIRKNVSIPLLRKDFIIDDYQIYEARVLGADAILLIAAVLNDNELEAYYRLAGELRLDVLAEAHDEKEVKRLVNIGFDIIGINNRNLKTFEVSLENTKRLSSFIPETTVMVCESGIKNNADMHYAKASGADAVLVGETLMRSGLAGIPECMRSLRQSV